MIVLPDLILDLLYLYRWKYCINKVNINFHDLVHDKFRFELPDSIMIYMDGSPNQFLYLNSRDTAGNGFHGRYYAKIYRIDWATGEAVPVVSLSPNYYSTYNLAILGIYSEKRWAENQSDKSDV